MERGSFQRYVASLEQVMKNSHFDLSRAMDEFQELCLRITPERIVPMAIVADIRQAYKQIQDQLTRIKGIHQLLEGKYRYYYHQDPNRAREIMEFGFLAKSLYFKFESTLQEIEAKKKLRVRGEHFEVHPQRTLFPWFYSKRNQIILLRNLRSLHELDYKTLSDLEYDQRREVIQNGMRSVSLFVLSGDVTLIDNLQSRMRLREYDIKERSSEDEFRGALTHLRKISLPEIERLIRRFTDTGESSKLKCLLLTIQSPRDLEKEIIGSTENVLQVMGAGEMRTLSI